MESQILLEPTSKALWAWLVGRNPGKAILCSVHVGSEGTDEDGGKEDTVATDQSAFRNVSLCYANGPAQIVGAYL